MSGGQSWNGVSGDNNVEGAKKVKLSTSGTTCPPHARPADGPFRRFVESYRVNVSKKTSCHSARTLNPMRFPDVTAFGGFFL